MRRVVISYGSSLACYHLYMKRIFSFFSNIKPQKRITYLIRLLLIAAILYSLASFVADGFTHGFKGMSSSDGEIVFLMILSLALTFSFDFLEKKRNIRIPHIISTTSIVFIFCGLFLGEVMDLYTAFWWWDDLLHTISGVLLGLAGFLLVYYFNSKFSMNLSPVFVALFVVAFAVLIGVMWEIFEFTMDIFKGSNMQRWTAPDSTWLLGKNYQGLGLRDTMSDLIVDLIGGLVAGGYAFYLFGHEKRKALKIMRETFDGDKKS